MTPFETERLVVRLWEERDRAAFHRLNSDDTVMHFFPFRRDRGASDEMMDRLNANAARDGFTFFALERKSDGVLLGMTGMAPMAATMPMAPAVEIGWRLLPEAWGAGYATEASHGCLARAFEDLGLAKVVSLCVEANRASEAVMLRLGFSPDGAFDHPAIDPVTHPDLVRHRFYRLSSDAWRAGSDAR